MAQKYQIDYYDVVGIAHKLEIYDDDYVGSVIDISGRVFLDYSRDNDILAPIKGSGLRVELEADSTLTFSDLYSEYDRDFKVIYYRNTVVKFQGFINPEGWYENFVDDAWLVSFDCLDGLSFLDDLSYVQSDGTNFTEQQSAIEVIASCLVRTGLQQPIKAGINIVYSGLTETLDILDNLKIEPSRYIKDDANTVMSCGEVLTSILELFTACIVSYDGQWYIYRPNQLAETDTFTFFQYDYTGSYLAAGTQDLSFGLGAEVDSFTVHHAGANQAIRNEKSVGAYRINYKYGLEKGLLDNKYLTSNGTTISEWTRSYTPHTAIPASNQGIILYAYPLIPTTDQKNLYSDNMALNLDDIIDLEFKFDVDMPYTGTSSTEYFQYKIICTGVSTYYWTGSNWTTSDTLVQKQIFPASGTVSVSFKNLVIPITGNLTIEFWTPKFDAGDPKEFSVYIHYVAVTTVDEQEDNIEGEIHTFQRTTAPNAKLNEDKEVFNGDNDSSIYIGSLFKADGTTLTSVWKRKGVTENFALLRLMGNETLRLKQSTRRVFSGDVYGFFDYLSRVTIDGLSGYFVCTEYSYDTQSNLISAEFKQVFSTELTDILYQKTVDRGNVVKPTITS